jgi:hypothetical protein
MMTLFFTSHHQMATIRPDGHHQMATIPIFHKPSSDGHHHKPSSDGHHPTPNQLEKEKKAKNDYPICWQRAMTPFFGMAATPSDAHQQMATIRRYRLGVGYCI